MGACAAASSPRTLPRADAVAGSAQPHVAARRLVTVLEGVVYSHTQGLDRDEPHSSRRGIVADLVTRTLLTLR